MHSYLKAGKYKFNYFMLGIFVIYWLFQNLLLWKTVPGISVECQTVLSRVKPDILSYQIWVQIVCKGYQQPTKDVTDR